MSEEEYPMEVKIFLCSDGSRFDLRGTALDHENLIERVKEANKLFWEGSSLYEALEVANFRFVDIPEVFKKVTKDTKFSIPHWQCRIEPLYSVIRLECDSTVFVHGGPEKWPGKYGRKMSVEQLSGYALKHWLEENNESGNND